jgi:hypothetical protein
MRAFFFSLLLIFGTFPAEAQNNIFIGIRAAAPISGSCPFLIDNGCAASIAGLPGSTALLLGRTPGGLLNQLAGTPTDYTANGPSRNQAGIDYYAGEYTPLTSLMDPISGATPITSISGCTYSATGGGGNGNPRFVCTPSTSPMNLIGYDFTRGGTTCIALEISGNASGLVTIADNYWLNNGNCTTSTAVSTMLQVTLRTTGPTVITNNTLDANKLIYPYSYGSCAPGSGLTPSPNCNPSEAFVISGAATVTYNYFNGFTARPLQYSAQDPSVGFLYKYNALVGCCSQSSAAHNEYAEYISTTAAGGAGETYIGNTFITTTFHQANGFAALPIGLPGAFGVGPTPIFNVSDNFYVDSVAGGGITNVKPTFAGNASGGTFTTTSIANATLGSGNFITCGAGGTELSFLNIYDFLSGTVSAGPGGGGNSGYTSFPTLNQISHWQMTWSGSTITAGLDNGSGSPGTIMTVTADNSLTLTVGTTIAFGTIGGVVVGTRTIQSFIGGSGVLGTYQMSGSAPTGVVAATAGITATPVDIFPGGWTVPGTLACASQVPIRVTSFQNPFQVIQNEMGQITNVGNAMDLWPYGSTPLGVAAGDINGSTPQNFVGTISTISGVPTLTINSGTAPTVGNIITTASGVSPTTRIVSGGPTTYVISPSQPNLGPVAMAATGSFCTTGPAIWSITLDPNYDMSGINGSTVMNSFGTSALAGNGCGP